MDGNSSDNRSPVRRERELIQQALVEADALGAAIQTMLPRADAVPGFRILSQIGRGGMGVVYRAEQLSTKRVVALKVLLAGSFASIAARYRFQREVVLAARTTHPSIVRVLESGETPTGQQYYAMDYVEGVQLDAWMAGHLLPTREKVRLFESVCDAVEHAHGQGVVHRDLKPANVLVDVDGKPHVLDFGLSKATDDSESASSRTLPGEVVGTVGYLSPEQLAGQPHEIDARTDVFALGVMLYEALTGALPFGRARTMEDMLRHLQSTPPTFRAMTGERVDGDLKVIILKALELEKNQRFQAVSRLRDELGRFLRHEPIVTRPPGLLGRARRRMGRHRRVLTVVGAVLLVAIGLTWGTGRWREANLREARRTAAWLQCLVEAGDPEIRLGDAQVDAKRWPDVAEVQLVWAQAQFRAGWRTGNNSLISNGVATIDAAAKRSRYAPAFANLRSEIHAIAGTATASAPAVTDADIGDSADAWYVQTFATLKAEKALHYALGAMARNPDPELTILLQSRLAFLHYEVGDGDAALAATEELIEQGVGPARWRLFQIHALMGLGRYAEALEHIAVAEEQPTSRGWLRLLKGRSYVCWQKPAEAIVAYTEAESFYEKPRWMYFERATPLWITGRIDEAAEDYRRFLAIQQRAFYADARLYLVLHELAERQRAAGQLAEADATLAEAQAVLAAAHEGAPLGCLKDVCRCLRGDITPEALVAASGQRRDKEQCEVYYYAGEACLLAGRLDAALHWFGECVAMDMPIEPNTYPPSLMSEFHLARWRLQSISTAASDTPPEEAAQPPTSLP